MKSLVILWILIFAQWHVFSTETECDLNFDNKDPSHILAQMEAIYSMDMEKSQLCFSMLKSFLIETTNSASETNLNSNKNIINTFYTDHRQENLERIQYLMSLLLENPDELQTITPDAHPELQAKGGIRIKSSFTHMNRIHSILSRPTPSDSEPSYLEKQIQQLQLELQQQSQAPIFWNPYLAQPLQGIPIEKQLNIAEEKALENTEQEIEIASVDLQPTKKQKKTSDKEYIWVETFHIEFPSTTLCKKSFDEISTAIFTAFKTYENVLTDFINNHKDMDFIYTNIIEWLDSIHNQSEQTSQNRHPIASNLTTYNMSIDQIPDFILNAMTSAQQESFTYMMNLVRKYTWMQNLYFEYRKCAPQIFQEQIWISYSAPAPFNVAVDPHNALPPNSTENTDISLSDINILYELSIQTPPFASSFKQSYPIRIFRQSNVNWNDFTENDIRKRYEPQWDNLLQFLQDFISRNRTYLDVSL